MALPPFSQVIKSRDVEDPVNMWLHRPLAYAFVALVHRTRLTPNQVTLTAMIFGVFAGACWLVGSPQWMVVGGLLLWTSSILDGADGILARAKQMQSEDGRALDGLADAVVALATVAAAFVHIWVTYREPWHLVLMPLALVTAVIHIFVYDFYKECYLGTGSPGWPGTRAKLKEVEGRVERAQAKPAPFVTRTSLSFYLGMLLNQERFIAATNEGALSLGTEPTEEAEAKEIYRRHNYWPMQLWTLISLCPHTYGMAICGIFDRLDIYLWIRLVAANVIFVVVLLWQRIATTRTLRDLHGLEQEVAVTHP